MDPSPQIRLRVAGLGHDCQFEVTDSSTLADIKSIVAAKTGIPPPYLLLLSRGKKLADGSATLSSLGVKDRTRLMLMHGPGWHVDESGINEVQAVCRSLDEIESRLSEVGANVVDELVTQACIRLDAVKVGDSKALRGLRKYALLRAEGLASRHGGRDEVAE